MPQEIRQTSKTKANTEIQEEINRIIFVSEDIKNPLSK